MTPEVQECFKVLKNLNFNQEKLKTFATSDNSLRTSYKMVSSGDLCNLKFEFADQKMQSSAYVHSEKTSDLFYKSSVTLSLADSSLLDHECTCKGKLSINSFPTKS